MIAIDPFFMASNMPVGIAWLEADVTTWPGDPELLQKIQATIQSIRTEKDDPDLPEMRAIQATRHAYTRLLMSDG